MESDKALSAAIAAVTAYIQTEEEAVAMASSIAQQPVLADTAVAAVPVNIRGISGRQSMMQMSSLMQMKAFNRI